MSERNPNPITGVSELNPTALKKGQIVLFTAGAYSSYGVIGLYEVLEDIDDVPQRTSPYDRPYYPKDREPDLARLGSDPRLRELTYVELWADE